MGIPEEPAGFHTQCNFMFALKLFLTNGHMLNAGSLQVFGTIFSGGNVWGPLLQHPPVDIQFDTPISLPIFIDYSCGSCSKFLLWGLANFHEEVYSLSVVFRETSVQPVFLDTNI